MLCVLRQKLTFGTRKCIPLSAQAGEMCSVCNSASVDYISSCPNINSANNTKYVGLTLPVIISDWFQLTNDYQNGNVFICVPGESVCFVPILMFSVAFTLHFWWFFWYYWSCYNDEKKCNDWLLTSLAWSYLVIIVFDIPFFLNNNYLGTYIVGVGYKFSETVTKIMRARLGFMEYLLWVRTYCLLPKHYNASNTRLLTTLSRSLIRVCHARWDRDDHDPRERRGEKREGKRRWDEMRDASHHSHVAGSYNAFLRLPRLIPRVLCTVAVWVHDSL